MISAFVLASPLIGIHGIKKSFLFFYGLCLTSSLLYIIIQEKSVIFIAFLAMLGRIGICPCYSLTFLSTNNVFPS